VIARREAAETLAAAEKRLAATRAENDAIETRVEEAGRARRDLEERMADLDERLPEARREPTRAEPDSRRLEGEHAAARRAVEKATDAVERARARAADLEG